MSESEGAEFREDLRRVIRRNDPTPEELRSAAQKIEALADRYEATEETL